MRDQRRDRPPFVFRFAVAGDEKRLPAKGPALVEANTARSGMQRAQSLVCSEGSWLAKRTAAKPTSDSPGRIDLEEFGTLGNSVVASATGLTITLTGKT